MKPAGQDLRAHSALETGDSSAPFAQQGQSFLDNFLAQYPNARSWDDRAGGDPVARSGGYASSIFPDGAGALPSRSHRMRALSTPPGICAWSPGAAEDKTCLESLQWT